MTDEEKNQIGLIRYGLIADLVSGVYKGSLNEFFLSKAGDITFYDGTIKKKYQPIPLKDGIMHIRKEDLKV